MRITRVSWPGGMTLAQLAAYAKVDTADVWRAENARMRLPRAAETRIARKFVCTIEELYDEVPDGVARRILRDCKANQKARALHRMTPQMLMEEIGGEGARDFLTRWSGWRLPTLAEWRRFEAAEVQAGRAR